MDELEPDQRALLTYNERCQYCGLKVGFTKRGRHLVHCPSRPAVIPDEDEFENLDDVAAQIRQFEEQHARQMRQLEEDQVRQSQEQARKDQHQAQEDENQMQLAYALSMSSHSTPVHQAAPPRPRVAEPSGSLNVEDDINYSQQLPSAELHSQADADRAQHLSLRERRVLSVRRTSLQHASASPEGRQRSTTHSSTSTSPDPLPIQSSLSPEARRNHSASPDVRRSPEPSISRTNSLPSGTRASPEQTPPYMHDSAATPDGAFRRLPSYMFESPASASRSDSFTSVPDSPASVNSVLASTSPLVA
eukprot:CAMPEP_0177689666 /NCGR_PEP_ID=MMETSP0484_2-20121128/327_1 /TAXON_ID=354590 /ORGANISM="Rhodomonas lens, Strain RHODO" /LENGTH=304 /DNA_ID=CAMNT_0019200103 /DNA_START=98 /DNA_END=1008 /DNA_ORIENTATION=-